MEYNLLGQEHFTLQRDGTDIINLDTSVVTSVGVSGNSLTWSLEGVPQTPITIPYATTAGSVNNNVVSTTYTQLKNLRDHSQLKPGVWYRITDYESRSSYSQASVPEQHPFDILVLATDTNHLSEDARAIRHSGDYYFENCNLDAWELKYCLDNDISRFPWACISAFTFESGGGSMGGGSLGGSGEGSTIFTAYRYPPFDEDYGEYSWRFYTYVEDYIVTDTEHPEVGDVISTSDFGDVTVTEVVPTGKGVIYYMKDDFGNECGYDFKNICWNIGSVTAGERKWVYTFTKYNEDEEKFIDYSMPIYAYNDDTDIEEYIGYCKNNIINRGVNGDPVIFRTNVEGCKFLDNKIGNSSITVILNGYDNKCTNNVIGNDCYVTFNGRCSYNIIDSDSEVNFGDYCNHNHIGLNSKVNFGDSCFSNTIGSNSNVIFEYACDYNVVDSYAYQIYFGEYCSYNTIGSGCSYIIFGYAYIDYNSKLTIAKKNYYQNIIIEPGNKYLQLNCTGTTSYSSPYRNVKVTLGTNNKTGSDNYLRIDDPSTNQTVMTVYQPTNSKTISIG